MQEAPPMTEDMVQDRQTALAALGTSTPTVLQQLYQECFV